MVNELLEPRQNRLENLFYLMIAFALLGPTFGIPVTQGFNLTFFRVAFILLAGGIIIRLVMRKELKTSYMYPVRWYVGFFVFWLIYALVSLTWAVSVNAGIKYLVYLGMMSVMAFSVPFFCYNEKNYWMTKRILFGVFATIVVFGVFESIALIHLPPSRAEVGQATVTSVFTNQNDLATCITLGLPFIITALFMLKLQTKHRLLIYFTGVFALYVLLATGSRSNTLFALPLAVLALVITVPFAMDRKKFTWKNIGKGIAAILIAAVIVNMMSVSFLSDEARQDAREKFQGTFGFFKDLQKGSWDADDTQDEFIRGETGESPTNRKNLILNGLWFLQKSNYMGVGAGNIEPLMGKNPPKAVTKVNMHNWWIEILVNFGVIIFVMYMALYVWMLWRLWNLARLKTSPQVSPLIRWGAVASLAALTGFVFGGVAPSTAIHFTPMWVTYGLGLATIVLGERQKQQREIVAEEEQQTA
ncbi:O-antigen ligase family protein [Paenactinomyces guangxiensis]|uniref:O-antigen ligase family protein n=1 Tax=Paenactinomyces guangxiensis TaxID=1490290 RepID=A0A7W1WTW9_9BACL|nr:O-antigen ligase family protein [Paenactinomyces guangxiensis]MBA4495990.1 O-antigen ligase family protein [Paenactinomyces guangxiensis]MBH8593023.1 O-antigen ligase family protein [Paenactinomyces guangxiensis]